MNPRSGARSQRNSERERTAFELDPWSRAVAATAISASRSVAKLAIILPDSASMSPKGAGWGLQGPSAVSCCFILAMVADPCDPDDAAQQCVGIRPGSVVTA